MIPSDVVVTNNINMLSIIKDILKNNVLIDVQFKYNLWTYDNRIVVIDIPDMKIAYDISPVGENIIVEIVLRKDCDMNVINRLYLLSPKNRYKKTIFTTPISTMQTSFVNFMKRETSRVANRLLSMKFTIVTVVFDIEYPLLLLQARSIVLYAEKNDIEEVIFVQNCDINSQKNMVFLENSINILQTNGFMVRVVHRDKFLTGVKATGWELQQSLKLMASSMVHTPYYLLLDTKNHFIRKINYNRLFVDNKAISYKNVKYGSMFKWLQKSMASLNLDIDENEKSMPTITPYLINTKIAAELMQYIGEPLDKFILKNNGVTEFFLYFAYLKKMNIVDKFYSFTDTFCATFFTKYPSTEQEVNRVKNLVENKNVFCMGVHRNRFLSCPPDFRNYLFDLWKKHELIYGEDDFNNIFDAMVAHGISECIQ